MRPSTRWRFSLAEAFYWLTVLAIFFALWPWQDPPRSLWLQGIFFSMVPPATIFMIRVYGPKLGLLTAILLSGAFHACFIQDLIRHYNRRRRLHLFELIILLIIDALLLSTIVGTIIWIVALPLCELANGLFGSPKVPPASPPQTITLKRDRDHSTESLAAEKQHEP